MYYEDCQTGSIYSVRELVVAARCERIPLEELAERIRQLPYSTCQLIEEAEVIAANAAEQQERAWLDRLRD